MKNVLVTSLLAVGAGLTALKFRKQKQAKIIVNSFVRKETHCEANITDGLGETYNIYGEGITWWRKKGGDPVPPLVAKAINEYRTNYMKNLIRVLVDEKPQTPEDVIVRDGKALRKLSQDRKDRKV